MKNLQLRSILVLLPLVLLACAGEQVPPSTNAQGGRANISVANSSTPASVMIIKQGTVGKASRYSVGVKTIDGSSARIAVWDVDRPQGNRNDYDVSFIINTGDTVPIGDKFYKVVKVSGDEIQIDGGHEAISLQEKGLVIPEGGVLELHGYAVEVVSITQNSANFEVYSNDAPKKDLEERNGVRRSTVSAGEDLSIGDAKHKITAIQASAGERRGFVELSTK